MEGIHWHSLEGDGIRLDPLRQRHAQALFSLIDAHRTHLHTWLPWVNTHTTVAHTHSLIEAGEMQQALDNGCLWGIWVSNTLCGVVDLQWIQWQHLAASIGYWLGASFTHQGIMTRALQHVCHFCFQELGLNRLEMSVACANQPSLALAQRVGFTIEGQRRDYERLHGQFFDHYALALLAREFNRIPS